MKADVKWGISPFKIGINRREVYCLTAFCFFISGARIFNVFFDPIKSLPEI